MNNEVSLVEESSKLFPLDKNEYEISMTAGGVSVQHRLKKPTLFELQEREKRILVETEEVSPNEDRFIYDDERANSQLWNKIAIAVKGYEGEGIDPEGWTTVTPQIAALMPGGHKTTAIKGIYRTEFEIEKEQKEFYSLTAPIYSIVQTFNEYTIHHTLSLISEEDRQKFHVSASQTQFLRGSRKAKTRVKTNLNAYIELYNKLFQSISGAIIPENADTEIILKLIDPIWKRGVIDCLMRSFDSALSD